MDNSTKTNKISQSLPLSLFPAGSDYTSHSLQLNFTRTASQTVTVDITIDTFLEFDETFFGHLTLVPTALNVTVNPTIATITIRDDDSMSKWQWSIWHDY